MGEQCFIKNGSAPPVCGVHGVRLETRMIPGDVVDLGHESYTVLVCPSSGAVVDDSPPLARSGC